MLNQYFRQHIVPAIVGILSGIVSFYTYDYIFPHFKNQELLYLGATFGIILASYWKWRFQLLAWKCALWIIVSSISFWAAFNSIFLFGEIFEGTMTSHALAFAMSGLIGMTILCMGFLFLIFPIRAKLIMYLAISSALIPGVIELFGEIDNGALSTMFLFTLWQANTAVMFTYLLGQKHPSVTG